MLFFYFIPQVWRHYNWPLKYLIHCLNCLTFSLLLCLIFICINFFWQLFLHKVFGYRGIVLFPWLARVYDRDAGTKSEEK